MLYLQMDDPQLCVFSSIAIDVQMLNSNFPLVMWFFVWAPVVMSDFSWIDANKCLFIYHRKGISDRLKKWFQV